MEDANRARKVEDWKLVRSLIEHENTLLNNRLNWHAATQAFLFTAWGAIATKLAEMANSHPPGYRELFVGLVSFLLCLIGIGVAIVAIRLIRGANRSSEVIREWWFQTHRDQTRENTIHPSRGSLNSLPPIDGIEDGYPKIANPELIPHYILGAWFIVSLGTAMSLAWEVEKGFACKYPLFDGFATTLSIPLFLLAFGLIGGYAYQWRATDERVMSSRSSSWTIWTRATTRVD